MKKKLKRTMAICLSAIMLCTAVNFSAVADEPVIRQGTEERMVKADGKWCYLDEANNKLKSTFVQINDGYYYFDENGFMLKPERGANTDAVAELMVIDGKEYLVGFSGVIGRKKGWILAKDERMTGEDKDKSYWFCISTEGEIIKAKEGKVKRKMVNKKYYAFDEYGHMLQNQWITDEDGKVYYALNKSNGELAKNRWLYLSDDMDEEKKWYYIPETGVKPEPSDSSPYSPIESVQLNNGNSEQLIVEAGKTIEIPISFTTEQQAGISFTLPLMEQEEFLIEDEDVASPSNAEIEDEGIEDEGIENEEIEDEETENEDVASPSNADFVDDDVMIMSNSVRQTAFSSEQEDHSYTGTKAGKALREAYDVSIYFKGGSQEGASLALKTDDEAFISFTSKRPCEVEIVFGLDGVFADSISVKVVPKNENTETDTKDVVTSIIGEQSKTVVDTLKGLKKDNLSNILQKNEDNIVKQIAEVEKDYALEYNIGLENKISSNLFSEAQSKKVKTVGAAMNAEENDDVAFFVGESSENIDTSSINKAQMVSLDLSLAVNNSAVSSLNIPIVITMPIPESIELDSVEIYHYHDNQQKKLETMIDEEGATVTFTTDAFSTFLFAGNSKGGSYSGGSSSSGGSVKEAAKADPLETAGTWSQDENGWKFARLDGKSTAGQWVMNGGNWFIFDEKGYMITGWYIDTAGKKFYLNPISDGNKGAMKTGWQTIDGKWYYFNTVSDGTKGTLLVNTTTPDGYEVNADGVWVP